jgi:hypothetical protein
MGIEKGFNAVFQFNAKKGTIGYVLDCSLRYISHVVVRFIGGETGVP